MLIVLFAYGFILQRARSVHKFVQLCQPALNLSDCVIPFPILPKCNCSSNLHFFSVCMVFSTAVVGPQTSRLQFASQEQLSYCPVYVRLIPNLRGLRGFYHLEVKIPLNPFGLVINRQALRQLQFCLVWSEVLDDTNSFSSLIFLFTYQ